MDTITIKTPLRISFVGGGTDLPCFYQKHVGAVISTTIDKYVTVKVHNADGFGEYGKINKKKGYQTHPKTFTYFISPYWLRFKKV